MFSLMFPTIALAGAVVHLLVEKGDRTRTHILEVALVWLLAVGIGATGIFAWSGHIFRADQVAESIGFPTGNPFQWEIGWANLAIGVLGVICIRRRDFWWPTAIAAAVFLWGAGVGHIYQAVEHNNHEPYNSGPIMYLDFLVPLAILVLLTAYHRRRATIEREARASA